MSIFIWILISTFLISLISFVGALTLFLKENVLNRILLLFVAFSAGSLIGGAFLHLIPESIKGIESEDSILKIFLYLIFGFCTFFILEQFLMWHHHHTTQHPEIMPFSYLILFSDGLHNFIDGLIIAGSFMISFSMGMVTSLAVALHEIPQEIGDFAVLVYGGVKKAKALFLNFISATLAILGGIIGFLLFQKTGEGVLFLLPFTAGSFIYIAASDLIPQIKEEYNLSAAPSHLAAGPLGLKESIIHFLAFLAGIIIMILIK